MKFRTKWLLAKLQPDPDVDPSPDGSNAIQTIDLSADLYGGNTVQTNIDRAVLGGSKTINTSPTNQLSTNVQFAGANGATADVPAGYSPLLRACGLSETIDSGVGTESVTYAPVSSGFEAVALYYMRQLPSGDQLRHPTLNAMGNMQISAASEGLPIFTFDNFLGEYVRPTQQATPANPVLTQFIDALPFTKGNTPTFTIDGVSFCVNSWSFNLNNTVSRGDEPNCKVTTIEDRAPGGQIVIDAKEPSTKDVFADFVESHNGVKTIALALVHGSVATQILEVSIPTLQVTGISEVDVRGNVYYTLDYVALPTDAGDDEFSLITK